MVNTVRAQDRDRGACKCLDGDLLEEEDTSIDAPDREDDLLPSMAPFDPRSLTGPLPDRFNGPSPPIEVAPPARWRVPPLRLLVGGFARRGARVDTSGLRSRSGSSVRR